MGDILKLEVWKQSVELATSVYKTSQKEPLAKDYVFCDQIRRAALSIPSNIAEGASSGFDKLGNRYFYNARGSCSELRTQLQIAYNIGYLSDAECIEFIIAIESILKMINNLISYRKRQNP